ncbi:MAG: tetratricopeptide repeat protein [Desulfobacteraceae bacterium]|nr:MAG: tetratricopeptide repeat protein [Desulfobacteraceae bacterium]
MKALVIGVLIFSSYLFGPACYADTFLDAQNHLKAGRNKEAETLLTRLISEKPNDAQLFNARARARLNLGNKPGAAADYDEALRLKPQDLIFLSNRGTFRELNLEDYAGAVADYTEMLRLKPQNTFALTARGRARQKAGDLKGALADLEGSLAIQGNSAYSHIVRGSVLEQLGRRSDAVAAYRRALEIDPNHAAAKKGLEALASGGQAAAQAGPAVATSPAGPAVKAPATPADAAPKSDADKARQEARAALAGLPPAGQPSPQAATAPGKGPDETKFILPEALYVGTERLPLGNGPDQIRIILPPPEQLVGLIPFEVKAEVPPHIASRAKSYRWDATNYLDRAAYAKNDRYTTGWPRFEQNVTASPRNIVTAIHRMKVIKIWVVALDERQKAIAAAMAVAPVRVFVPKVDFSLAGKYRIPLKDQPYYQNDLGFIFGESKEIVGQIDSPPSGPRREWVKEDLRRETIVVMEIYFREEMPPSIPSGFEGKPYREITAGGFSGKLYEKQSEFMPHPDTKSEYHMGRADLTREGVKGHLYISYHVKVNAGNFQGKAATLGPPIVRPKTQELLEKTRQVLASLKIVVEGEGDSLLAESGLEFMTDPAGKKEIRADGRDVVLLRARVPGSDGATRGITFAAQGEGAGWVDLGKAETRGGWMVVPVQASNPDAARGTKNKPPAALTIRAEGKEGGRLLSRSITLTVPPEPVIDASPDLVEFAAKTGQSVEVKVGIENAGKDPWGFRTEYAPKNRELARVSIRPVDGSSAVLTLTEAGLDPETGGTFDERSVLRIIAEQKDRVPLEREVKVRVGQEGVFVVATGRDPDGNFYRVDADGRGTTREIDFRVLFYDPARKKLVNSGEAVGRLAIESIEPETGTAAQVLKAGRLRHSFSGIRASNDPSGIYRFSMEKEVPGDGRVIRGDFRVRYPGRDEENFTAIVTLGFATTSSGPGGKAWQEELKRCQEIIDKFVPATYRPKLQAILESRKMTLGAEGLHALREKIWRSAVELTLGEGGQGYENEAAWADRITVALEWTEWAGDMAFGAVIGTWTGPYGATGAGMLKAAVVSALNAYGEGRSPEEWMWENLCTIPGLLEGKIIDPDNFQKMGVESRAKVWAVFVGYHFCKNLYNGATVVDALKNTAREAGSEVLSGWLSDKVKSSASAGTKTAETRPADKGAAGAGPGDGAKARTDAGKAQSGTQVEKVSGKDAAGQGAKSGKEGAGKTADASAAGKPADEAAVTKTAAPATGESDASRRIRRSLTVQNGKPYANRDDVLAIMRDPSMVRALKKADPEIQAGFSNTREAAYRQHDGEVVQFVKDTVPDMKYRMVKVIEFRTPGDTGSSLNTDRDYRVCYYAGRHPQTGKEQWIEVDRRHWEDKSYEAFARATGGPTGSREAAKHWAEEHQQLGTDKFHAEASPDFSDQRSVWNPQTRKVEKVQVIPDVVRVKSGQAGSRLKDPQALGYMYQMKVGDARFKHEKFVQAQKAVLELDAIRKGSYKGRSIGSIPEKVRNGMNAVVEVNKKLAADPNRRDPKAIAEAEKTLRENGFHDLDDFMNKLGSQFQALGSAK